MRSSQSHRYRAAEQSKTEQKRRYERMNECNEMDEMPLREENERGFGMMMTMNDDGTNE